jgi:hypothetical protein
MWYNTYVYYIHNTAGWILEKGTKHTCCQFISYTYKKSVIFVLSLVLQSVLLYSYGLL